MPRPLATSIWIFYTIFILYGSTIPFRVAPDPGIAMRRLARLPLNPLISSPRNRRVSVPDTVQNILFYLPFGVLGMLSGASPARRRRVWFITLLGCGLSVSAETLQLFTVDRIASVGDVTTNTLGTWLGAFFADRLRRLATDAMGPLSRAGLVTPQTFYPMLISVLVVLAGAWQPFDITIDVRKVGHRVLALARDPWQGGPWTDEGVGWLQFALCAMASSAWLTDIKRRALPVGLIVGGTGLALAVGLEASQLVIASRMPSLEDAVVRATGVLTGILIWRAVGPRLRQGRGPLGWLVLLALATATGAAIQMFTPFAVASTYHTAGWFPLLSYYHHTTFETLSHAFELFLIYFPIAFCLARSARTPSAGMVWALLVALAIAAPIEYGQGWFVGRFPDVSDVGLSLMGAWFGALAGGRGARLFEENARRLVPGQPV